MIKKFIFVLIMILAGLTACMLVPIALAIKLAYEFANEIYDYFGFNED